MSETLLPCPFCGAPGFLGDGDHWSFFVECSADCGCSTRFQHTSEVGAIAAWNRRAPTPVAVEAGLVRYTAYPEIGPIDAYYVEMKEDTDGAWVEYDQAASALSSLQAQVEALTRDRDECERLRELMAKDWMDFCDSMGVRFDTQEAVAYDLQAQFSNSEAEVTRLRQRVEEMDAALWRDLNVTDEELLRIRNTCVGHDGDVKIWGRMLQKLADAIRAARRARTKEPNND